MRTVNSAQYPLIKEHKRRPLFCEVPSYRWMTNQIQQNNHAFATDVFKQWSPFGFVHLVANSVYFRRFGGGTAPTFDVTELCSGAGFSTRSKVIQSCLRRKHYVPPVSRNKPNTLHAASNQHSFSRLTAMPVFKNFSPLLGTRVQLSLHEYILKVHILKYVVCKVCLIIIPLGPGDHALP